MKVLITGANGQLGLELQKTSPAVIDIIALSHRELDITDRNTVNGAFKKHLPDVVVNTAAYTAVDMAEKEADRCFTVNTIGTENVAHAAMNIGAKLIHISTDFVFDGRKSMPYSPKDETNPLGVYGTSKLEGEKRVSHIMPGALIIRTAWLYSGHGNNFVKSMLGLMQERKELSVVDDQVGTPTWANGLAIAIWNMIDITELHGIYHWSDAGLASWYDFSVAIQEEAMALELLQKEIPIRPISSKEYPTPAQRPAYSVLDKAATWKILGYKANHWRKNLRNMLSEIKGN